MIADVKYGAKVKPRALLAENAVIRGDAAYVLIPARPHRAAIVREFTRCGPRWRLDGEGRADLPYYAGLFPEQGESPR
jgi:hypothetical protein